VPRRVPAPEGTVDHGNLPAFLRAAMRRDLALSPPEQHPAIRARIRSIRTRGEAVRCRGAAEDSGGEASAVTRGV
jgi:hypothetical protein